MDHAIEYLSEYIKQNTVIIKQNILKYKVWGTYLIVGTFKNKQRKILKGLRINKNYNYCFQSSNFFGYIHFVLIFYHKMYSKVQT